MSNSKHKYDWDNYLPKMISLYHTGMSIPEIWRAIQDESTRFTPGQSIVYQKLRAEGYPTDKNQRARFLEAHELSRQAGFGVGASSSGHPPIHPASFPEQSNEDCNVAHCPSTSNLYSSGPQQTPITSGTVDPSILEYSHTSNDPGDMEHSDSFRAQDESAFANVSRGLEFIASSDTPPHWTAELPVVQRQGSFGVGPSTFLKETQSAQIAPNSTADSTSFDTQEWFDNSTLSGYPEPDQYTYPWEQDPLDGYHNNGSSTTIKSQNVPRLLRLTEANGKVGENGPGELASTPRHSSTDFETQPGINPHGLSEGHNTFMSTAIEGDDIHMSTVADSSDLNPVSSTIQTGNPNNHGFRNTPSPTDKYSLGERMFAWVSPRAKFGLMDILKRDSGYASGRNSPLAPSVDDTRPDPSSLLEFKGLYRVPCKWLHQPKPIVTFYIPDSKAMERFKDTPTCSQCLYSSVHNLSWSAQYLGPAVFKAELMLDTKYNIAALDKVGNSALHYAAAGGAGVEHFAALIEAGVNPWQINTAGQLFLHCLRPHIREIGSEGFDDNLVATFHAGLIDLLNAFQPKGAFRWRDNEGRTVLDALASNIKDTEIRTQIFRHIRDAGYPLEVSSQYPTKKSSRAQSDKPSPATDINFIAKQDRQQKAHDILRHASMEPSYIDPDTGDNVLHALARLKPGGSLISKIQEFVLKDIDLNLHNRDRDCPLAAFVSERPFLGEHNDETGATMSKYLDALLWSDARHRIPNRINVNMRNREGVSALYYAAVRARPDSVRSLIEAGANVNVRQDVDGHKISILQATMNAKTQAVLNKNELKIKDFENVISYLEHENAVAEPSLYEERAVCENSVRVMPM